MAHLRHSGRWSQSAVRHVVVRVAEPARLAGVADDRQCRAQTNTGQRQQHSHRGLRGELLELAIELDDAVLQRLYVGAQSAYFCSQTLQIQPFLPASSLVQ